MSVDDENGSKPGSGIYARKLLKEEKTENAKLLTIAIDALENRAESAERLNKVLGALLVVVVVVFLGRELDVDIPGVGSMSTSAGTSKTP